jgi:hypothetical protein
MSAQNKCTINQAMVRQLQAQVPEEEPTIFVLDDPNTNCRSSATFLESFPNGKVFACSTNPSISTFTKSTPMCMASTHALQLLVEKQKRPKLNYAFLDYCGTPDEGTFKWTDDVKFAIQLLSDPSCPIYLTFCKRGMSQITTFVQKIIRETFLEYCISDIFEYCDTTAMVLYTIHHKSCAFQYPGISAAISNILEPQINESVLVSGVAGKWDDWHATIRRRYNNSTVEVVDHESRKPFQVNVDQIVRIQQRSTITSTKETETTSSSSSSSSSFSKKCKKTRGLESHPKRSLFQAAYSQEAQQQLLNFINTLAFKKNTGLKTEEIVRRLRRQVPSWPFHHRKATILWVTKSVKDATNGWLQQLVLNNKLLSLPEDRRGLNFTYFGMNN